MGRTGEGGHPSSRPALQGKMWLSRLVFQHLFLACFANQDAKRLYSNLLANYNRLIRPVANSSDRLTVHMRLKLSQVIGVDMRRQILTTNVWVEQEWADYKLSWNPADYGGVKHLHVPSQDIWLPDIVLYNNADGNYEVTIMTKAILNWNGKVNWNPPAIYKSYCGIDVEFFPFDEQECWMKFGSWTYDGFMLDLRHMNQLPTNDSIGIAMDLRDFYISTEWDVMEVPAQRNEKYYPCCEEPYPDIVFSLKLRRKTLFYTVNLIIPCMGISFLTVLVFYLPSDSGEKVSLSISILLSLTVFFLLLAEIIPPTSLVVPLLGKFVLFTMILDTFSICVTVVVLNVHFRSPQTQTMAPWVRRVFIHILPRLLVMRRPGQEAKNPIMRKYNQNKIKSSGSGGRIEDYILEQAMLTSSGHGAMSSATTTKIFQGFLLPPPPPPGSHQTSLHHNHQQAQHHQQDFFSESDHAAMSLSAGLGGGGTTGYTTITSTAKHNNVHHATANSDSGGGDSRSCQLHGDVRLGDTGGGGTAANNGTGSNECPEINRALDGVRYIAECTMREEESVKVKEDWKYIAMVLDRLFLWIFTVAVLVGSAGIILQAPALYDTREAIDLELSEIEAATAKPLSR